MMRLIAAALSCVCLYGQSAVVPEDIPPQTSVQQVFGYSGANLTYQCFAMSRDSNRSRTPVAIASATNANPVVFTVSGGHGFATDGTTRPAVTISGGTGSWAAVNKTYTATILSSTTFSVPQDSTSFGAVAGTLSYTTNAPRTTVAEWSVKRYTYDGSSNLIGIGWDNGNSRSYTSICSASTTSNVQ